MFHSPIRFIKPNSNLIPKRDGIRYDADAFDMFVKYSIFPSKKLEYIMKKLLLTNLQVTYVLESKLPLAGITCQAAYTNPMDFLL